MIPRPIFLCAFGFMPTVFAAKPNIVFINADDLGWADVGFMGSEYYETPNLDRLAMRGVVFNYGYAPAANCQPSRASVYTGQATVRHGVLTVGNPARGDARHRRLIPAANLTTLDPGISTFPKLLQQSGYRTMHVGKWHLSDDPKAHGFDVNIAGSDQGMPWNGYFSPYRMKNLEDGPEGEYLTERLGKEAARLIRDHDDDTPFLLSMQFYSPHTPLQAKADRVVHFEVKPRTESHSNPVYAAMISHVDDAVGDILGALEARAFMDNTLIVFSSDNGGIHHISQQFPLRGEKGSYYEGGIRVPLVMHWPGKIGPPRRSDEPVTGLDFFPTFLDVAGVEIPDGHAVDGESLLPMLTGTGSLPQPRELVWHFPVYLEAYANGNGETRDPLFRTRPGSVIITGMWKLHHCIEDDGLELYYLPDDPSESTNVAKKLPGQANEMLAKLNAWRDKMNAPMPLGPNPKFDQSVEANAIENWEHRHAR